VEKLRRDRPSNLLKDSAGKLCLEVGKKRRKFASRWTSSVEEHLVISQDFIKEERTVGILRGEFATFREPLDLTEVQGRYDEYSQKVQSSGGAEPLIRATRAVGSTRISCIGVSWIETPKYCNGNRDIAIRDIPTAT
jgi:hypothetical protein